MRKLYEKNELTFSLVWIGPAELMAVPCVNPQRRKVSREIHTKPEH